MKKIINHPALGEIIYEESLWTGKRTITVNGTAATKVNKKEYAIEDTKITVKGSLLFGCSLIINGEKFVIVPSVKWYEIAIASITTLFILAWGNSTTLCSIFPLAGGAIGGGLCGCCWFASLATMKLAKKPIIKILIGLLVGGATVLVAFLLAITLGTIFTVAALI